MQQFSIQTTSTAQNPGATGGKPTGGGMKRRYSKTKLGCKTCKVRKIRCDETPPACRNCAKSGRRCDGVAQPAGAPGSVTFTAPLTLTYFRPTQTGWLSQEELVYLELFRQELIYSIIGDTHSPSWKRMILQAVHEEVALCHAVVAYSALSSQLRSRPPSPSSTSPSSPTSSAKDNHFALRHYGKALESMRHVVHHNDSRSINVALLCTLLCICFELRIQDPAVALTHLEHGLHVVTANLESVDEAITTAFARLDLQASIFLGVRPPALDAEEICSRVFVFDCLHQEADVKLMAIVNKIFHFLRDTADDYRYRDLHPVPDYAFAEEVALNAQLYEFHKQYLEPAEKKSKMTDQQMALLRIKYLTAVIVMAGSLDPDETIFHRYTREFVEIVDLAEAILRRRKQATPSSSPDHNDFALDMSIIHPLYITGTKCRSPITRRRAINLLLEGPASEGVWESTTNAAVCEAIMMIEEAGIDFDLSGMGNEDLLPIPEENLIHSVDTWVEPSERHASIYVSRRLSGLDQGWHNMRQDISW